MSAVTGAALATASDIAAKVADIWNTTYTYGAGNASAAYNIWDVTHTATNDFVLITARNGSGRRGYDKSYSFALVTATSTTTPVLAWQYGATAGAGDNKTISGGIVVTIESTAAGKLLDTATNVAFEFGAASATEYTSSYYANANILPSTSTDVHPDEARGDAINGEANITEVATEATSTDRTAWL